MKLRLALLPAILLCALLVASSLTSVFALWHYTAPPEDVHSNAAISLHDFRYSTLYITRVNVTDGTYQSASITKTADLDIQSILALTNAASSSVTAQITFYNNTDASFYYKETETLSWDNNTIGYTLTGLEQKDEIKPHSYKTVTITFAYTGSSRSNRNLNSSLRFHFVVDKDSIGTVVAQTAVDRFLAILNNQAFDGSYQYLEDSMNSRSGYNKASAVTYIGNVYGSSSGDSGKVKYMFGDEFMSMDLDGDGKAEPITMMIKRENLDNHTDTGDSYTYTTSSWWGPDEEHTVDGAEMTIYITADDLSKVSSNDEVVVYAAAFTKLPGAAEWTALVPLTKGIAYANNYGGYGSANSFNTDTWVSDSGYSIEDLVTANS